MSALPRPDTPGADPAPNHAPVAAGAPGAGASERAGGARERLLAAATRLFADQGYDATTTREICLAAGANPGQLPGVSGVQRRGLHRLPHL